MPYDKLDWPNILAACKVLSAVSRAKRDVRPEDPNWDAAKAAALYIRALIEAQISEVVIDPKEAAFIVDAVTNFCG